MGRIICWFSCGAASACATKLILDNKDYADREIIIARNHVAEEHPDSERFAKDCERWFSRKITSITNDKYSGSAINVWENVKFMKNQHGAPCTRLLKKEMRKSFQRDGDIHVFGFTSDEAHRSGYF